MTNGTLTSSLQNYRNHTRATTMGVHNSEINVVF